MVYCHVVAVKSGGGRARPGTRAIWARETEKAPLTGPPLHVRAQVPATDDVDVGVVLALHGGIAKVR